MSMTHLQRWNAVKKRVIFILLVVGLMASLVACRPVVKPKVATATAKAVSATPQPNPTEVVQTSKPSPTRTPWLTSTARPSTATPIPTPFVPEDHLDSIGDPYSPELGNSGYDVDHYLLKLEATPEVLALTAEVTITGKITLDEIKKLYLDFVGFEVNSALLNGEPVAYDRLARKLVIEPRQPLQKGQPFEIIVSYHGQPKREPSEYSNDTAPIGLQISEPYNIYANTEPDGSRYWFPCNDHPRDKATYRFEITVPPGMTGVANGILLETQKDVPAVSLPGGKGDRFIWEHNFPTATYLTVFAVGEYERVEAVTPGGVKLRSYVFPSEVKRFKALEPRLLEMTDWMTDLLTPYPFDEYGYVTVLDMDYCMETQGMVLMGVTRITESCMVHELAHMWFGDWVSLDSWGEIWRNEGFATYLDTLWEYRNDEKAFNAQLDEWMENKDSSGIPLNNQPKIRMFSWDSYMKGALLVRALEQEMGKEAFFKGLRAYLNKYGGSSASDAQFIAEMEAASEKDLKPLFDEWFK